MDTPNDTDAMRAQARLSRVPNTISIEAQNFLLTMAAMPPMQRPAPGDIAGWKKAAADSEAFFGQRAQAMLAASTAKIETRSMGGVRVYVAKPQGLSGAAATRAYLYIHGGAFVFGGGDWPKAHAAMSADALGVTVYSVDYRMAPDHPFPAAPEDCLSVYRALIENHSPGAIAIGGSSAGGNLALVTALMIRDRGLPAPASIVLLTPETDLTESGDTFQTHESVDVVLKRGCMDCNIVYANGKALTEPYLSPVLAEYECDFPPVFIQSGTRDLFLSNCAMLHRKMLKAGVRAELHVWEAMPHGGFGGSTPEDAEVNDAVCRFLAWHWKE